MSFSCDTVPQDSCSFRWRFWRFLTADGNFVLDHLIQSGPDDAVWLINGAGFFAERLRFGQFKQSVNEGTEVSVAGCDIGPQN